MTSHEFTCIRCLLRFAVLVHQETPRMPVRFCPACGAREPMALPIPDQEFSGSLL